MSVSTGRSPFKGRSIFPSKPRSKHLSDVVKVDTPANARSAAAQLRREFNQAKTHKRKLHIYHATHDAARIAGVMKRNPRLSGKEHREAAEIEKTYDRAAKSMAKKLPSNQ